MFFIFIIQVFIQAIAPESQCESFANTFIRFDHFLEETQYGEEGYYSSRIHLGESTENFEDFTTFSSSFCAYIHAMTYFKKIILYLNSIGQTQSTEPIHIIEVGTGSGEFLLHLLKILKTKTPSIFKRVQVQSIDLSERLQKQASIRLKEFEDIIQFSIEDISSPFFRKETPLLPNGIIITNELLDEMFPRIIQYHFKHDFFSELYIIAFINSQRLSHLEPEYIQTLHYKSQQVQQELASLNRPDIFESAKGYIWISKSDWIFLKKSFKNIQFEQSPFCYRTARLLNLNLQHHPWMNPLKMTIKPFHIHAQDLLKLQPKKNFIQLTFPEKMIQTLFNLQTKLLKKGRLWIHDYFNTDLETLKVGDFIYFNDPQKEKWAELILLDQNLFKKDKNNDTIKNLNIPLKEVLDTCQHAFILKNGFQPDTVLSFEDKDFQSLLKFFLKPSPWINFPYLIRSNITTNLTPEARLNIPLEKKNKLIPFLRKHKKQHDLHLVSHSLNFFPHHYSSLFSKIITEPQFNWTPEEIKELKRWSKMKAKHVSHLPTVLKGSQFYDVTQYVSISWCNSVFNYLKNHHFFYGFKHFCFSETSVQPAPHQLRFHIDTINEFFHQLSTGSIQQASLLIRGFYLDIEFTFKDSLENNLKSFLKTSQNTEFGYYEVDIEPFIPTSFSPSITTKYYC